MLNIYSLYDFHRFEGEGGEGLGAEANAFLESLNGGRKQNIQSQSELAHVEYGQSEGVTSDDSQNGTGTGAAEMSLEDKFAQMVSKDGEYHDIYGQRVSQAIQDRFKNQADLRGQVDQYEQAIAPLLQKYGLEPGDIEGLTDSIANDVDIYRAGAEEAGLDVKNYMEQQKLKADAERGRQIMEAYQQEQERNRMFAQWDAEAEQIKGAFPNFDLGKEIESNERFLQMLDGGASVQEAFVATHMAEILSGMQNDNMRQAQANVVSNIQRQAARPPESGMRPSPAIQKRVDPSTFNDADIDEILRRTQNGEKFKF